MARFSSLCTYFLVLIDCCKGVAISKNLQIFSGIPSSIPSWNQCTVPYQFFRVVTSILISWASENLVLFIMFTASISRADSPPPSSTPPPYSFYPEQDQGPLVQSPSQEPKFVVGDFETAADNDSSYGAESGYPAYDSSFRIELTHIEEKDLLDPLTWPRSPPLTCQGFDERLLTDSTPSDGLRWTGILRFTLRLCVLVGSAAIIGLLTHSTSIYFRTKTVHFPGADAAWPDSVKLFPTHFLLAVAIFSLSSSFILLLQSFWNRVVVPIPLGDIVSAIFSGISIAFWIASAFVFERYKNPNKASLVWWACYRKGGPADQLVAYDLVCSEHVSFSRAVILCSVHTNGWQRVAQDIGIALNILELFALLLFAAMVHLNRHKSSTDKNIAGAEIGRPGYKRTCYA